MKNEECFVVHSNEPLFSHSRKLTTWDPGSCSQVGEDESAGIQQNTGQEPFAGRSMPWEMALPGFFQGEPTDRSACNGGAINLFFAVFHGNQEIASHS